jgi:cytidylate kinase
MKKGLLITIDGPAGAGKSTVGRLLADRMGYMYIDTGALYRAVALAVISQGCRPDDDEAMEQVCQGLKLVFKTGDNGLRLYMNDVDVTDEIRNREITMQASAISAKPLVRAHLLEVQRGMGQQGAAVFEGRDMGTVVFPQGDVKFYLDADPEVRAFRRYKELCGGDERVTLHEVADAMRKRDANDSSRDLAPLRPARDAVRIDSTALGIGQVVDLMVQHIARVAK